MTDKLDIIAARRRFLATAGRFAIATPPAVTLMLAGAGRNYAVASGGGGSTGPAAIDPGSQTNGLPGGLGGNNNCNAPTLNAITDMKNCKV